MKIREEPARKSLRIITFLKLIAEEESITAAKTLSSSFCLCKHCLKKQLAVQLDKFPSLKSSHNFSCRFGKASRALCLHQKAGHKDEAKKPRHELLDKPQTAQSPFVPTENNRHDAGNNISVNLKDISEICSCSQKMYRSLKKIYSEKTVRMNSVKLSVNEQHLIALVRGNIITDR